MGGSDVMEVAGLAKAMLVGPLPLERAQALRQQAAAQGASAVLTRAAGRADPERV